MKHGVEAEKVDLEAGSESKKAVDELNALIGIT